MICPSCERLAKLLELRDLRLEQARTVPPLLAECGAFVADQALRKVQSILRDPALGPGETIRAVGQIVDQALAKVPLAQSEPAPKPSESAP